MKYEHINTPTRPSFWAVSMLLRLSHVDRGHRMEAGNIRREETPAGDTGNHMELKKSMEINVRFEENMPTIYGKFEQI